jgi:hypothetical protein
MGSWVRIWIAVAAALLLGTLGSIGTACMRAASVPKPAPPDLDCRLTPAGPFTAGGPVALRFTLTNRGAEPLYALRWYTPLEGVRGDLFVITSAAGGSPLPYQGPLVKRGDPRREDYVELTPGQPVSGEADIAPAYGLDRPGSYTVELRSGLSDLATDPAALPRSRDAHRPAPLSCAPLRIEIFPSPSPSPSPSPKANL